MSEESARSAASASATAAALHLVRTDFSDDLVPARVEAESEAVALLDACAGSMTRDEALQLGRHLSHHRKQGSDRQDRFSPAFHGKAMYRLVEDLDAFNAVVGDLWTASEDQALDALGDLISGRVSLRGAGTSFPSVLMYLRDPERWGVLIHPAHGGLGVLTGRATLMPSDRRSYEEFSASLARWRREHGVAPQEADVVLTEVWREHKARFRPNPTAGETAPSSSIAVSAAADTGLEPAMDFLADLAVNNTAEWMEEHRGRYVTDLRAPFSALMAAIAEHHLRPLDPQLTTEVKTGKVLASIRKRFPDEDGPYQRHFWGAFSRFRKQEDVQLAVLVDPDTLYASLYLGSAPEARLQALRAALTTDASALLAPLAPYADRLTWVQDSTQLPTYAEGGGREVQGVPLDGPAVLQWLDDGGSAIQWRLHHGDPLLADPKLAHEIGRFLTAVHSLASAAWGDDLVAGPAIDDGADEDDGVALRAHLSLNDVAAACHLPAELLEGWVQELERKPQAYFYGPPGTGKSHVAALLAQHLATSDEHVHHVQFHPSYSYEDFVEGLRPQTSPEGHLTYAVRPGIFQNVCSEARRAPGERFVVVLDEMNRADLASVLGELLQLLEHRGQVVVLPYSQKRFSVPPNIVVLATMNTADRSLTALDFALRRRFLAFQLSPSADVLRGWLARRPALDGELVLSVFSLVADAVGADSPTAPGHSYWMDEQVDAVLAGRIWDHEVRPYLAEHWYDQLERLEQLDAAVRGVLAERL